MVGVVFSGKLSRCNTANDPYTSSRASPMLLFSPLPHSAQHLDHISRTESFWVSSDPPLNLYAKFPLLIFGLPTSAPSILLGTDGRLLCAESLPP